jgi:hypothetical protein
MYSRFLREAADGDLADVDAEAALCADAAARWTDLASSLLAASETDDAEPELWRKVGESAESVLEIEERLWPALAAATGRAVSHDRQRANRAK